MKETDVIESNLINGIDGLIETQKYQEINVADKKIIFDKISKILSRYYRRGTVAHASQLLIDKECCISDMSKFMSSVTRGRERNIMIAQMQGVKKNFGKGETLVKALDGVDFEIEKGEFVAVLGASGSGKSTFLNLLGGLDKATEGTVIVDNNRLNDLTSDQITEFRRKYIGFVFQDYNLITVLSVYENIVLPIHLDGRTEDVKYVEEIMELLGINNKKDCLPNQLSGGQQQRVAIARAMASKPAIILADEPTGNLDSESTTQVMELLKESAEKYQQTIIFITHNDRLTSYCDRVLWMKDGKLIEMNAGGDER